MDATLKGHIDSIWETFNTDGKGGLSLKEFETFVTKLLETDPNIFED